MKKTEKVTIDPETEKIVTVNENIRLITKKKGLPFGTDSYFLAAFAKSKRAGTAAELGAGTGIVSLLCSEKRKYKTVYSIEIDESCADAARRNAALNGLDGVKVICADIRDIRPDDTDGQVDSVISNPPYLKCGNGKTCDSPELEAAHREHSGGIADFCAAAGRLLKYGGTMYVVWKPDRLCDLFSAMRAAKIEPKRIVPVYAYRDCPPSLVLVEGKSGASYSLSWSRPLFIYERHGSSEYTDDTRKIYETFSLDHLFNNRRKTSGDKKYE